MKRDFTLSLLIPMVLLSCDMLGQHTVGLISYDANKMYDGYNLFFSHNQSTVFLLNNCGEIVHSWDDLVDIRPGNTVYLLENGDLVKASRHEQVTDDVIWAGGGGEFIEIRDWDNNLKWKFTLNDSLQRIHHDIEPLPNGNILANTWERKTYEEAVAAGRDTALLSRGELWSEAILEIMPVGDTFEIVWEWHVWDHMIQDYDSLQANFGVVGDHPELVDMNYADDAGPSSWMHMNAIDYHPVLDQIVVSIPTYNEVWIIDHTTTTAEAASHAGGLSGRGGDLMYRWGNPETYRHGAAGQRLFFQHDVHWVDDHLDASHPHFGKIAVFNNRAGADSSSVEIFSPLFLDYAWMYGMNADDTFLPTGFDWGYGHPEKEKMFSGGLSSVQILPNGNTLILSGRNGYAFEITEQEEIIWEYEIPFRQGVPVAQGEVLANGENQTFRFKRYPADFPAFDGRDLSPKGFIELDPDTLFCDLASPVSEVGRSIQFTLSPNPAYDLITLSWDDLSPLEVRIYDGLGRQLIRETGFHGSHTIELDGLTGGVYYLRADRAPAVRFVRIE